MSLKIKNYQQRTNLIGKEHEVLEFWEKTDAFKKSVKQRPENNPYIFYDGPPFATGTPHYGHILASTAKDVIPRYWTMKGYRVERVWGWDCHGLPIENIVEKELDLKGGKKGIEEYGIANFNQACRNAIWRFDKEWERVVRRIGRWVDFKNSYKTMDMTFMESVWWAFKQLYEKGLIYEGRKVILYCSRCATPLSNFEIAMDNSYKDDNDYSITIKFPVKNKQNEYLLAWTTTPWTLIGNVGLAVNPDASYLKIKQENEIFYLAAERQSILDGNYQVLETLTGKDLAGTEYEPLYPYLDISHKKAHYVATADFVSLSDGTGIVHTAAIYGEDDYNLAQKLDLPLVPMLDDQGKYLDFVTPLAGMYYLKAEKWVVEDLENRKLMYKTDRTTHSVAHCYRCDTKLYYNAVPAWFIDVQKLKTELLAQNEFINWYPEHLKHGRFGKGLDTAPDWNISRSRYWGNPMPIWRSVVSGQQSVQTRVIGSLEELKKWAVDPKSVAHIQDIHREFLDDIEIWVDDAKTIKGKRIREIFDCWVESGSMPFASMHYPFENKVKFEHSYPAQYIAEYIAQTRAWFYTLHVISVGLFGKPAFQNAVTTGNILAQDGRKMSKSKKNYPDPEPFFEKYGVDALRFYLMGSVVMKADNVNFSENEVKEIYQKLINTLWNTFSFYKLYAGEQTPGELRKVRHVLDRWIVSKMASLSHNVTQAFDAYNTVKVCRLIQDFVTDLSTWYLRRSRDRLRQEPESVAVFGWVLHQLVHIMAPLTPFVTELIYQNLTSTKQSVHLNDWPKVDSVFIDKKLESNMELTRKIVEGLHSLRQQASIKVRQPLSGWSLDRKSAKLLENELELLAVIAQETNIKGYVALNSEFEQNKSHHIEVLELKLVSGHISKLYLDIEVTPELQQEGQARELVRQIQDERKKQQIKIDQHIDVLAPDWPAEFEEYIKRKTLTRSLKKGKALEISTPVN